MKRICIILLLILIIPSKAAFSQLSPREKGLQAITMESIKGQLEFLASDWMEGRGTGEKGFYLASDYVASMFRVYGAAPSGDPAMPSGFRMGSPVQGRQRPAPEKSYFQNFTLVESRPGGESSLSVTKGGRDYFFEENIDFTVSRAALGGKIQGPAVFVGYGLVDKDNGIDDFAGTDVKGKVIVRLSGFPGSGDVNSPMYKKLIGDNQRAAFEISRKKNEALTKLGAAAVIELNPGQDVTRRWGSYKFDNNMSPAESNQRSNWTRMMLDEKDVPSDPVTLSVTERISTLLFKDSGIDLNKYITDAAAGIIKFKPVILPGTAATLSVNLKSARVNVRNVVAVIEGENKNEFVAVGAHMDHMGIDNGKIWNGADDNASGTVAVMTIAKAFVASGIKPKRSIVFCAWTGEEKGLYGSEYFTRYPAAGKINDYIFYMNFDMIARDAVNDTAKNMAGITYTKAYPKLEEISKNACTEFNLNLKLNIRSAEAPTGGSDYTAFTENKIPVIAWMAAMHPDYHQPSDQINLVNWNKMLDIIKLGYLQLWEAANGEIK